MIDQVWFTYDQVPVLQGLSFEIPSGKSFALVGTSGGGKSSTIKVINQNNVDINHLVVISILFC